MEQHYVNGEAHGTDTGFHGDGTPSYQGVYEHGFAYSRSVAFYDQTLIWQWMRFPGDVVFAAGALLMAWDFLIKLRPLYPRLTERLPRPREVPLIQKPGE